MKKLVALITLCCAMPAFSADWTPYLKGMQDGCGYGEDIKKVLLKKKPIPKELKGDVVKHTQQMMSGEPWYSTIKLKNATAFGYPLLEIKDPADNQDMSGLQLKFGKVDDKLLSKFYVKVGNKKLVAGKPSKTALLAKYKWEKKTKKNETIYESKLVSVKEIPTPKSLEGEALEKYFADDSDSFTSLMVATKDGWVDYSSGVGDGMGYSYLKFDTKQKTLTCASGY